MPESHDDLIQNVLEMFFITAHRLQRTAMTDWLKLDLTMAQLKVLFTVVLEGPTTIGKIAEPLGIGQPTASHLVDRLVQAGLVERVQDSTDRRYTLTRPTPQGEEVIERLRQGRQEQLHSWLAQLSAEELAALRQGMQALIRISALESFEERGPFICRTMHREQNAAGD